MGLFLGLVSPSDMVDSESAKGIKSGDSSVVIQCEGDELIHV